jgi:uncharacterized LabA/DUF88 family protein
MRRIAILIDGGYFLKRLPKLVAPRHCETPEKVLTCIRWMCRDHIKSLTGYNGNLWHQHVYRIFFYDAVPYNGQAQHPLLNRQIDFGKSDLAQFRQALFEGLRRQRKMALRLGKVVRDGDWTITGNKSRKIIATRKWFDAINPAQVEDDGTLRLTLAQLEEMKRLQTLWTGIENHEVRLNLRQKGVDMRIGIDITSLTLKKQVDTIILVAGDSDFVPAAKLARREGVEFILDPMWQSVNDDLFEHIDGLHSGLARPKGEQAGDQIDGDSDSEQPTARDTVKEEELV